MDTIRKSLRWFDDNLLFLVTGFLLAFIPLFPKIPLFDVLPGYIVRIRMEDFLIVGTLLLWLVQLVRGKASFGPNPLTKPVIAYLIVGVLSMISAIFITQTVPFETLHIGKMFLHFLRRIEYFSLFFVFYSSIKSIRHVKVYIGILVVTVVAVTLYGYGQKYLYWPAFSTMNREYSKGWVLYLDQHSRVLSTFGGHYDLAAYIMGMLTFLWMLFFSVEKKIYRVGIFLILTGAFWLLILTASRTSFLAYLGACTILFILWSVKKGINWAFTRWLTVMVLSIFVMLSFGDLSDRFTKLLKLDQRFAGIKSLILRPFGAPPKGTNVVLLQNNWDAVTSKSDTPLTQVKPVDVVGDGPIAIIATQSASGASILVEVPPNFSQAAITYDLSTGIRFDALWPRAFSGFLKNPLLGSGYSTLTKTQSSEFTEAESTDNDFLRALGETGLLGFLTFGWILGTILVISWKAFLRIRDVIISGSLITLAAVVIGLLINAMYIDVFEASKVAYSFWAFAGIVMGGIKVAHIEKEEKSKLPTIKEIVIKLKQIIYSITHSEKTYILAILVVGFVLRYHRIHEPLADWHSWRQADTSSVTRNYVRYGIDPLFPRYDDLSSIGSGLPNPEGYRFVEFPIYNIFSVIVDKLFPGYSIEYSGRLTSIFFSLGTTYILYLLVKKYLGKKTAFLTSFFFAALPYNIFYSRVILPEPALVFFTTFLLFTFDRWLDTEKKRWWFISVFAGICALLIKFTTVFFVLPMAYLVWKKWKFEAFKKISLYVFAILIVVPFLLWRMHISAYPEGIPAYTWLLNGNHIRLKGAWFWWLFAERIGKLILGVWGIGLLMVGLLKDAVGINGKRNWFFHWWGIALLLYLVVFATGNVQHDYYQVILVPIICIFLAKGAELLLFKTVGAFNIWSMRILLIVITIFMLMFGWYQARDLFNINHREIVEAGSDFDRVISNTHVKVIAPYGGDTAFLYQTGRSGWPIMEGTIDEMIQKGAHYYISTNFDDTTNEIIAIAQGTKVLGYHQFKIIKRTDNYIIVQLVPDNFLPKNP